MEDLYGKKSQAREPRQIQNHRLIAKSDGIWKSQRWSAHRNKY